MRSFKHLIKRPSSTAPSSQIGPVGLELAREQMHIAQLERLIDGDLRIRAKVSLSYPGTRDELMGSSALFKSFLKQHLKPNGFHGCRVVATIPTSKVRVLSIAYPGNRAQTDAEALLQVLKERVDGELTDYVIDYLPVRPGTQEEQRLAVVALAKRPAVLAYLELLRAGGLRVEALEIGPVALKRLVAALLGPECYDNVLVVNFGHTVSYLTMISGRRLLFDQSMDFGEQGLVQSIAGTLEMSQPEAKKLIQQHGFESANQRTRPAADKLADENAEDWDIAEVLREIAKPKLLALTDNIKRALIYAASETRGEPVKQVYLAGSLARWSGIATLLNTMLEIPVSTILGSRTGADSGSTAAAAQLNNSLFNKAAPEMAVATGLALRGFVQDG